MVSGRRFKGERAGTTAYSRNGEPINGHFFGQSSFATYSITTADALVKVPGEAPPELLGHLACGMATGAGAVLNEARPRLGDSVLIVGVGPVGLAAIMAARNSGVTKILAAEALDHTPVAKELQHRFDYVSVRSQQTRPIPTAIRRVRCAAQL